jgi:hypothetical protein
MVRCVFNDCADAAWTLLLKLPLVTPGGSCAQCCPVLVCRAVPVHQTCVQLQSCVCLQGGAMVLADGGVVCIDML